MSISPSQLGGGSRYYVSSAFGLKETNPQIGLTTSKLNDYHSDTINTFTGLTFVGKAKVA
jgi:hypothetical protein